MPNNTFEVETEHLHYYYEPWLFAPDSRYAKDGQWSMQITTSQRDRPDHYTTPVVSLGTTDETEARRAAFRQMVTYMKIPGGKMIIDGTDKTEQVERYLANA